MSAIKLSNDILLIAFNKERKIVFLIDVFKDLLATTATSTKLPIDIIFGDDDCYERLTKIITEKMGLKRIKNKSEVIERKI